MSEESPHVQEKLDELIGKLAEEHLQRLRDGEKPDIEEYAQRHPGVADAIRQILPALEVMGQAPTTNGSGESAGTGPARGVIGDYRIIREVGRGGMGVVYEAEQISLGRRVALKVLPFAAVLDERQIKRFRNEALAVAQLDHPHIVDVYGVGCERSVHFYTMRFVDGESLSAVIDHLRAPNRQREPRRATGATGPLEKTEAYERADQSRNPRTVGDWAHDGGSNELLPTANETSPLAALSTQATPTGREFFRNVARIGIEVAEALDHAHQQGVIHRDIKPANIILDGTGKAWVADFGLARIETGVTMTMTGDLVGTVRYMSPEQAMAKRVVVDHRTDVYSLGVTLYELLTLQPAFPEEDRHELLRRIASDEPRPPRKLNAMIPAELDTIILKASAKVPGERYESAQELADDLKRFLEDRPIRAKPPGIIQLATKWSRRHASGVLTSTAVFLLLSVVLTVSNVLITWQRNEKQQALDDRNQALAQAKSDETKARKVSELILSVFSSADPYGQQAKDYKVRDLLDDFSHSLEGKLDEQPEVAAEIHRVIGVAYRNLKAHQPADKHLDRALELHRRVYGEQHPLYAQVAVDHATNVIWTPEAAAQRKADAARLVAETLPVFEAQGNHRGLFEAKSLIHQRSVFAGNPTNTQELFDELMELAAIMGNAKSPKLGVAVHNHALWKLDHEKAPDEAERLARRAIELHLDIDGPDHPETGYGYRALAKCLMSQGSFGDAEQAFRRALAIFESNYESHLMIDALVRGIKSLLRRQGKTNELGAFRKAYPPTTSSDTARDSESKPPPVTEWVIDLLEKGDDNDRSTNPDAGPHPNSDPPSPGSRYGAHLLTEMLRLGLPGLEKDIETLARRRLASGDDAETSMTLLEILHAARPEVDDYRKRLAAAYLRRGVEHDRQGRDAAVLADWKHAVELDPDQASGHWQIAWKAHHCPDDRFRDRNLSLAHARRAVELAPDNATYQSGLGRILWDYRKDRDAALEHIDRAIELDPKSLFAYVQREWVNRSRFPELALADLQRALEIKPNYTYALRHRANIRQRMGQFENALDDYNRVEELATNRDNLSLNHRERAGLYRAMGRLEEALADFDRAIELRPRDSGAVRARRALYLELGQFEKVIDDLVRANEALRQAVRQPSASAKVRNQLAAGCKDLAYALRAAGRFDESERAFREALDLWERLSKDVPDKVSYLREFAYFHVILGDLLRSTDRPEKAEQCYRRAIAEHDRLVADTAGGYRSRLAWSHLSLAQLLASGGSRAEAEPAFRQAIESYTSLARQENAGYRPWYELALAQLAASEPGDYRTTSLAMLEKFATSRKPSFTQFAIWTCVLAPGALSDYSSAIDGAERLALEQPKSPDALKNLGAVLFRAGKFEQALRKLAESDRVFNETKGKRRYSPAYAWFFLAMAHHESGNAAEARSWLDKAIAQTDAELNDRKSPAPWNRRLTLELFRKEAEAMIDSSIAEPLGEVSDPKQEVGAVR